MNYKHAILIDKNLKGWQYGMQRELEKEIITQTNAEIVEIPEHRMENASNYIQHGRRLDFLRNMLPKTSLKVEADIIWHILMGPFDYNLDVFSGWYEHAKYRIVYVFDPLEETSLALKRIFSKDGFNIRVSSFNDAVPFMERLTGKKWFSIEQGVPEGYFQVIADEKRIIPFSSYGRRLPSFHNILKEFAIENNLYYDYSIFDGSHSLTFDDQMYRSYAWHIAHSVFNVCWPVELTSPVRAGRLRPITCRWFEVAASGTCILGKKPENPYFDSALHRDLVVEVDPYGDRMATFKRLDQIWRKYPEYLQIARQIRGEHIHRWTWRNRVQRMLALINKNSV